MPANTTELPEERPRDDAPMPYDADLAIATLDRHGVDQAAVARACNIAPGHLSRQLSGQHALRLDVAVAIYQLTRDAAWLDHFTGGDCRVVTTTASRRAGAAAELDTPSCAARSVISCAAVMQELAAHVAPAPTPPRAARPEVIDAAIVDMLELRRRLFPSTDRATERATGLDLVA